MSRCLGIDYGSHRVGLALSDETGTIASPLETVPIRGVRHAVQATAEICTRHNAQSMVVGLPLHLSGDAGAAAEAAQHFAALLREHTGLPVVMWDERLSTSMAEKLLLSGNVRREKRRALRDQVAAQIVLQSYLDAQSC